MDHTVSADEARLDRILFLHDFSTTATQKVNSDKIFFTNHYCQ